jgi:hypothetical protein
MHSPLLFEQLDLGDLETKIMLDFDGNPEMRAPSG